MAEEATTAVRQRTIWKFPLALEGLISVAMPEGAEILHFAMQGDTPTIWALVEPSRMNESRHFQLAGTGHPLAESDGSPATHIGTCVHGPFVWHLFEQRDGSF